MPLHHSVPAEQADAVHSARAQLDADEVPIFRLPDAGIAPDVASQLIHDELLLDGNAGLNLATFVTTWMEPAARQLIDDCLDKNIVDKDEYPQTAELELRCVNMLADLWSSPQAERATGCSTTGSSEGCMLAGLALKWRWRERRRSLGAPTDRPNLVLGANAQICWDKFCRYWDVEPRLVALAPGRTHLTAAEAAAHCDENTIGVVAILGSTLDGSYEPVSDIARALDELQQRDGLDIPLHVDAASGGFVAPFLDRKLEWDFRLERVQSINASGHKYGLVYPGVGWVVWRNEAALPEQLVFHVNYLGGDMPTFALNFSRPGAQVISQYFNFLRLGRDGYTRVQQACRDTARWLAQEISQLGPFELISDGSGIPVFAFRLREDIDAYSVFDVSTALRTHGWLVPAYTFPANLEQLAVLRVVVRNGFSRDMAQLLLRDLRRSVDALAGGAAPNAPQRSAFHH